MSRRETNYFIWRGERSSERGVSLLSAPSFTIGATRGNFRARAALPGEIWVDGGAREGFDLKLEVCCRLSRAFEAASYLTGSGLLVFSWMPTRALEARIAREITFSALHPAEDPLMRAEVAFHCQPYWRLYPDPRSIWIPTSGARLYNPGTAPALPRVRIYGAGDFSVSIGGQTVYFSGVPEGGIIVDSETMRAAAPSDGAALDQCLSGTPWRIAPGRQEVSWSPEEQISSIEIEPGWRYLL